MGTMWNLIRVATSRGRLAALLMAALFGWASSTQITACTPNGVQCPTAPVQTVVETLSCCGKTVGYAQRPVRPGDKGFVQCRCAEKRAAQHSSSVGPQAPHYEMLCAQPLTIALPILAQDRTPTDFVAPGVTSTRRSPSVPPPSLL